MDVGTAIFFILILFAIGLFFSLIYLEENGHNRNRISRKEIRFTKNDAEKIVQRAHQRNIKDKYASIIEAIQNAANNEQRFAVIKMMWTMPEDDIKFLQRKLEKQGFSVKYTLGEFVITWDKNK
jgi:hypothetical protein